MKKIWIYYIASVAASLLFIVIVILLAKSSATDWLKSQDAKLGESFTKLENKDLSESNGFLIRKRQNKEKNFEFYEIKCIKEQIPETMLQTLIGCVAGENTTNEFENFMSIFYVANPSLTHTLKPRKLGDLLDDSPGIWVKFGMFFISDDKHAYLIYKKNSDTIKKILEDQKKNDDILITGNESKTSILLIEENLRGKMPNVKILNAFEAKSAVEKDWGVFKITKYIVASAIEP